MKLKLFIDPERDEEIIVYAHKKSSLTDAIEQLVSENGFELIGYTETQAVKLNPNEIFQLSEKKFLHAAFQVITESNSVCFSSKNSCRILSLKSINPVSQTSEWLIASIPQFQARCSSDSKTAPRTTFRGGR